MVAGALRLAGKLMGPKAFRALGGAKGLKEIGTEALVSGGLNTGLTMMAGGDPLTALAYGSADALASAGSLGLVRGMRPKGYRTVIQKGKDGKKVQSRERVRSKLEMPVNIAASVASTLPVTALLGAEQGIQNAQPTQILQQQAQRATVNNTPVEGLAGAYMPFTNLQEALGPTQNVMLQQYLNDMGTGPVNDPNMQAAAYQMLGL